MFIAAELAKKSNFTNLKLNTKLDLPFNESSRTELFSNLLNIF